MPNIEAGESKSPALCFFAKTVTRNYGVGMGWLFELLPAIWPTKNGKTVGQFCPSLKKANADTFRCRTARYYVNLCWQNFDFFRIPPTIIPINVSFSFVLVRCCHSGQNLRICQQFFQKTVGRFCLFLKSGNIDIFRHGKPM